MSELQSFNQLLGGGIPVGTSLRFVASDSLGSSYDPHLNTALKLGLISQREFEDYARGVRLSHVVKARTLGKTKNYVSMYEVNGGVIPRLNHSDSKTFTSMMAGIRRSQSQWTYDLGGVVRIRYNLEWKRYEEVMAFDKRLEFNYG